MEKRDVSIQEPIGSTVFDSIVAVVFGIIVACVCGGGLIGLIIGIIAGVAEKKMVDQKIGWPITRLLDKLWESEKGERWIGRLERLVPEKAVKQVVKLTLKLSELGSLERRIEKYLREEIRREVEAKGEEIVELLSRHIDRAIEAVSEINQI